MPLKTNTRLIRAMRELVLGNSKNAFPVEHDIKPAFPEGAQAVPLARSTPEAEGVQSRLLENFYRHIANMPDTSTHALAVTRHGKVIAEGYFAPYRKEVWHVTHSMCKTFVGAAVGLAIEEELFQLDDSLADHFADKIPFYSLKKFKEVKVRHLLTMSSGITFNEVSEAVESEWLRGIFSSDLAFAPGSRFVYNSMNSYLLSALVCRTSGQGLMEFLTPRLFVPMGFGPVAWEKSAEGFEKGGWGMYITLEDMLKFGQLYLQNGRWTVNGQEAQLLPESWVLQSTTTQMRGAETQEYGYHIWTDSATGAFVMNGMFGQYVAGFPSLDMVVAMTAANPNLAPGSSAYTLMRSFADASWPDTLPPNPPALRSLQHVLAGLRNNCGISSLQHKKKVTPPRPFFLRLRRKRASEPSVSPEMEAFCGITWRFAKSYATMPPMILQAINNNFTGGVRALRFEVIKDTLHLYWEEDEGTLCLPIGFDVARERTLTVGDECFLIACQGEMRENEDGEAVLKIQISFLEYSSCRLIKLIRRGDKIFLYMDEMPQLSLALETAMAQNSATAGETRDSNPLTRILKNNDYLHYRIKQLCTPEAVGQPVLPED